MKAFVKMAWVCPVVPRTVARGLHSPSCHSNTTSPNKTQTGVSISANVFSQKITGTAGRAVEEDEEKALI